MACMVLKAPILPLAKVRLEGHSDLGELQGKKGVPRASANLRVPAEQARTVGLQLL